MSSSAMKWAKRQRIQDGVLLNIVKRLSEIADSSGASWASQGHLATACGISERSVRRSLRLLEQFGIISRTSRSRGRHGRTSDLVVLALHRDFDIGRPAIRRARAMNGGSPLQPDNRSVPTGQCVRGIMKGTTYPIQEEELTYQGKALPGSRPALAVVAGTAVAKGVRR